jgi:peptidyl-tRNA hydrolase
MIQHVLGRFQADERAILGEAVERAVQAVDCLQREGIAATMNQFN